MKNKFTTAIILTITFLLAGVAIFTAIRLYQLRNQSISPTSPESKPAAAGNTCGGIAGRACPAGETCIYADGTTRAPFADAAGTCQIVVVDKAAKSCSLSFTLGSTPTPTSTSTSTATATATSTATSTSTATATATSTSTSTATATATPTIPPYCGASCGTSNSNCQSNSICYQGSCRNPSCVTESDCLCQGTTTSTPSGSQPTASQPSLPNSGTSWPTIIGAGLGVLVIFGSLLLAL